MGKYKCTYHVRDITDCSVYSILFGLNHMVTSNKIHVGVEILMELS